MEFQPLEGVRVLDFSRVLAGPLCTMHLGDLGANVIKVERPIRGDDTREWGPPFDARGESAYYLSVNRNKISIALDLASAPDRDVARSLIRHADVVVDNFVPGALERLGFPIAATLHENRELIWCSITGFGPVSTRPGYDFVVQAESGWMAITGEPDGAPMKSGIALADIVTGKDAALAIVAALAARVRRVSVDRHLVVSLATSARAALVNVAQNSLISGAEARRWGNGHANLVPYQLFETRDRPIVIGVGNDEQWRACVRALDASELEHDVTLSTNRGRLARRADVVAGLQRLLVRRPAREWIDVLAAAGVPCGVVKSVLEAIDEAGAASAVTGMPSPLGGTVRRPPPRLDEHGALVRQQGWNAFAVTV